MNTSKIGLIQALGTGYELVLRAFWVLFIPVALDVFLWLGPRLSVRAIFERLIVALARAAPPGPEFQQNLDDVRRYLSDVGSSFNLFGLLATDFMGLRVLPLPTLKAFELPQAGADGATVTVPVSLITVDNFALVAALAVGLLIVGLLIGVAYLTLLADRVRANRDHLKPLPVRVLIYWLRLLLFVALLGVFYFFAGIPFFIAFGIATLINFALGFLVVIVGWTLSFWLALYLWFVAYAIVIADVGVLRAMWHSANVVQRNLFATFGLILLSNVIVAGTFVVWQLLEASWLGSVVAIVGNAFVGSGLVMATFVFYQDRYQVWRVASGK